MIKIEVTKEKDIIVKYEIIGHAMYDDYGKDIVCAAVSSIVITTINGILMVNKNAIKYTQNNDGLLINNITTDEVTNLLLKNMDNLLHELSKQYSKNIKFI